MKWKYTPKLKLDLHAPQQFLLLCTLLEINPQKVLYQFMCHVGAEAFAAGGIDQKERAMQYFISCGYGQDFYSTEDISQIFRCYWCIIP